MKTSRPDLGTSAVSILALSEGRPVAVRFLPEKISLQEEQAPEASGEVMLGDPKRCLGLEPVCAVR